MTNRIKLKRTEDAGKIPTTTDIDSGEVAVNIADKKIYIRDSGSQIIEIGGPTPTDYVANTGGTFTGSVEVQGTNTVNALVVNTTAGFDGAATFNNTLLANHSATLNNAAFTGTITGIDITDLTNTPNDFGTLDQVLKSNGDGTYSWGSVAISGHTHEISDVNNLQNALDAKSDNTHTHTLPELGIVEGDANDFLMTDGNGTYTWQDIDQFYYIDGGSAGNIYGPDEPNIDAGGA